MMLQTKLFRRSFGAFEDVLEEVTEWISNNLNEYNIQNISHSVVMGPSINEISVVVWYWE